MPRSRNLRPIHLLVVLVIALPGSLAAQTIPSRHGVVEQEVVLTVPGAETARVRADIRYAGDGAEGRHLDLYLPPSGASEPQPVVVFVNGGDRGERSLKEWPIYRSWARLVTTRDLAAVTFENREGRNGIAQLLTYLRTHGNELGIDPDNILVWMCSANTVHGLPLLMEDSPAGIRAAVVYYGRAEVERFDIDLPIFYARAGRDRAVLNDGIDALWVRAVEEELPWTMVNAPDLHHAFDALDDTDESRRIIRRTLDFLQHHARPPAHPPLPHPLARAALAHWFGHEWAEAAAAYDRVLAEDPDDAVARIRKGAALVRAGRAEDGMTVLEAALEAGQYLDTVRFELARGHALSGSSGRALEILEALTAADALSLRNLDDEAFASLASTERFASLRQAVGASPEP